MNDAATAMHSVVLIDDHDIVRLGLETLIGVQPGLRIAGSAGSLKEGLALIGRHRPDLVITDMATGDSSGLDTVRAVLHAQGPRPTIVLSMHDEALYGEQVLAMGAHGYVMKETASADIVAAARAVLAGGIWMSPRLGARLLARKLKRAVAPQQQAEEPSLSLREIQVLELLKSGRTTKEIAASLDLSARTVDIYRASIKRKLGLRTGAELIAYASHRL